jgi:hypothetical protein
MGEHQRTLGYFYFALWESAPNGFGCSLASPGDWKDPDHPLVIGLAFQVGGGGWFWSRDPVMDAHPY